jgi:pimeloyl-ACP methyl ester carboxylesterase
MVQVDYFKTKPSQSGLIPINSHEIYYEVHGDGVSRILFIAGFTASMRVWREFVDYYVGKGYSVLVLENRGAGMSTDGNFGRYTTSGMAQDIVTVLGSINWLDADRCLHVVGCSMGGMIAQELALIIGTSIKTLTLMVTTAKQRPPPHRKGQLWNSVRNMMDPPDEDTALDHTLGELYHPNWLAAHDPNYPEFATNKDRMWDLFKLRWNSEPPLSLKARLGQGLAVQTHHCTTEKLLTIKQSVPYILSIAAEGDNIIDPECTVEYCKVLGIEPVIFSERGHGVIEDSEKEILELIDALIVKSEMPLEE